MDARGHGDSDKPDDPHAYVLPVLVEDVIAVLTEMETDSVHFFGYDVGGRVGLGLARYVPERLKSLVVGSCGAVRPELTGLDKQIRALRAGTEMFISQIESTKGVMIPEPRRSRELANDSTALTAMLQAIRGTRDPGIEPILKDIKVPTMFYAGTEDPMHQQTKDAALKVSGSIFLSLPGADYYDGFERSGLILPQIKAFLAGAVEVDT